MTQFDLYQRVKAGEKLSDVDSHEPVEGEWAVHFAAIDGDLATLKKLAMLGQDLFRLSSADVNAFDIALDYRFYDMCAWLIEQGEIVEPRPNGDNALDFAARDGDRAMAEFLIEHGAKVDGHLLGDFRPPIIWAIQEDNFEVFDCLLSHGAKIFGLLENDGEPETALRYAAADGKKKHVERMLEDLDIASHLDDVLVALEMARAYERAEIVEMLEKVLPEAK